MIIIIIMGSSQGSQYYTRDYFGLIKETKYFRYWLIPVYYFESYEIYIIFFNINYNMYRFNILVIIYYPSIY